MNDKYLSEVMHAYAAGCLDHEDLIPLLGLLDNDGQANNPELGELQNLTSLLPAILMIENPPAAAKDKIARKLYAIREEIIARKIKENDIQPDNNINRTEVLPDSVKHQEQVSATENVVIPVKPAFSPLAEMIYEKPELPEELEPGQPERYIEEKPYYPPRQREDFEPAQVPPKKEGKGTLIALIIVFILLVAGVSSAVYYIMQQRIDQQQKSIAAVKADISVLNDEIIRLNKIQRILAILGSKDVSTINLDGTIDNPMGFGKIVFDPANKEGLLSLFNMPALPKEKSYQLWLLSKGQPFSLGLYSPQKEADRYIPINEFPDIPLDNIDAFQLTLEDVNGSDSPKGPLYLSSSVKRPYRPSY